MSMLPADTHRLLDDRPAPLVRCQCGVRAAADCPDAWEPGCDLGANPDHAQAVPESPDMARKLGSLRSQH